MFSKLTKKKVRVQTPKLFFSEEKRKILCKQKHQKKQPRKPTTTHNPKQASRQDTKSDESFPQNEEEFFCWGIDSKLAQPRVKTNSKKITETKTKFLSQCNTKQANLRIEYHPTRRHPLTNPHKSLNSNNRIPRFKTKTKSTDCNRAYGWGFSTRKLKMDKKQANPKQMREGNILLTGSSSIQRAKLLAIAKTVSAFAFSFP
jgi:hypothetical protein